MPTRVPPADFDYKKEPLDAHAQYVRDMLSLPVEAWVRFRYRLHDADSTSVLFSSKGVSDEVKQAFLEMGTLHRGVLLALGYAKVALLEAEQQARANRFLCAKAAQDFYGHAGIVLANLARIAFTILHDATRRTLSGKLVRNQLTFSTLQKEYPTRGYRKLFGQKELKELDTLCRNLQDAQLLPLALVEKEGVLAFPSALRTSTKPWHTELYGARLRKYTELLGMMRTDWEQLFAFQHTLYEHLTNEVARFEKTHGLLIR